ncbi:AAA family ATPase [Bacillus mangrovi]|uniref:AAA family ATPase n=1 Tax=Metabacillus mangrovi TaxID=1491830 RepID=A0A7X2S3L6_9BACI|nr:MinD/ParA family protein [Metabacillus mangrovi]MTH52762.1 AAA family ATPase [Metabacillus mangrovi]
MSDQAQKLREMFSAARQESKIRANAIGVASGKGGTGKTSFTVNFCLQLAEKGKRVLLFDFDIGMGNVDIVLGEAPEYSILDFWQQKLPLQKVIQKSPAGIDYIAGGRAFNDFFLPESSEVHSFLHELEQLMDQYDYIFFDMGAGMTKESLQFLLAADEIILVVTPEPTSLMDAYSAAKHILLARAESRLSLIINKSSSDKEAAFAYERISSVLAKFLSAKVQRLGFLPEDSAVSNAVLKRSPVTVSYPKSKYSKAIRHAAGCFLEERETGFESSHSGNFMARLKNLLKSTAGKGG